MIHFDRRKIWLAALLTLAAGSLYAASISEVILPQYIQGMTSTNNDRIPFAYRVTLSGLSVSATYRYFNQCIIASDTATASGAGNIIFPSTSGAFTRTSSASLSTAGGYGSFTTDASGSYTGWFITEPSGNARFTPGNQVFMRISLNNGAGGTSVATRLTTSNSATVLKWDTTSSSTTGGTGFIGKTSFSAKSMAFLYDNTAGTGRPIAGTLVENDGLSESGTGSYVSFFGSDVEANDGRFGTIIPNILPSGVRRIEGRSLSDGSITNSFTDDDGVWSVGSVNTVYPTGGKTSPLTVQAGLPDDPNIYVGVTKLYLSASSASSTAVSTIVITNNGASAALDVTTATLTGGGAAKFSVTKPYPSGIAAASTSTLEVVYSPGGSTAMTSATLTIGGNDQSGDAPSIQLFGAAAPAMSGYAGLLITEVATQPTADEFVEIANTSASPINIGGVVLSDEDNNNTEGSVAFPAGTQIAAGEVIVVAVNNSATEPSWLDTLPINTRVFCEPARNTSAWTPAQGNTLTRMDDFTTTASGTSDAISLSSGDGVALYAPGIRFISGFGPFPVTATIDGMNYPKGDTGPSCPINPTGQLDTADTKAGTAQPASGHSLTRVDANANVNSYLEFTDAVISPGSSNLVPATPTPTETPAPTETLTPSPTVTPEPTGTSEPPAAIQDWQIMGAPMAPSSTNSDHKS